MLLPPNMEDIEDMEERLPMLPAEDVMEAKATAAILVCFHLFSEIENVVKKEKFLHFGP